MQVLCLRGQRKSMARLKSELRKPHWIYRDTFWLQSFGTRNSSLANAKIYMLLYSFCFVLFWIWGIFPTPSRGFYLEGRFIGGFFALLVWGALCCSASPAFNFVLFYTISDVQLQHLKRNQSVIFTCCVDLFIQTVFSLQCFSTWYSRFLLSQPRSLTRSGAHPELC